MGKCLIVGPSYRNSLSNSLDNVITNWDNTYDIDCSSTTTAWTEEVNMGSFNYTGHLSFYLNYNGTVGIEGCFIYKGHGNGNQTGLYHQISLSKNMASDCVNKVSRKIALLSSADWNANKANVPDFLIISCISSETIRIVMYIDCSTNSTAFWIPSGTVAKLNIPMGVLSWF